MNSSARSFGILTLATPNDYLKAIGLALSARVSNPGVPIAVACSRKVMPLVEPYFDVLVEEKTGIRGFAHKVYLDEYSPFDDTFFFDSDVLLFKPVLPYARRWESEPYRACGKYEAHGFSTFGLDRAAILTKIGKPAMVVIDGAGHAFFRKPDCYRVFARAREITEVHKSFCGDIPYADEDVIDIVMTEQGIEPAPFDDFFSRYLSSVPGTLQINSTKGECHYIWRDDGNRVAPCMMHFAADEAPIAYTRELVRLFKHFNVATTGLWSLCLSDLYKTRVRGPLHEAKVGLLRTARRFARPLERRPAT